MNICWKVNNYFIYNRVRQRRTRRIFVQSGWLFVVLATRIEIFIQVTEVTEFPKKKNLKDEVQIKKPKLIAHFFPGGGTPYNGL